MVEFDTIHFGADHFSQAIVRRRRRVERSQSQAWHPFVDLLRDERHMEEQLRSENVSVSPAVDKRRGPPYLVLFTQKRCPVLFDIELVLSYQI